MGSGKWSGMSGMWNEVDQKGEEEAGAVDAGGTAATGAVIWLDAFERARVDLPFPTLLILLLRLALLILTCCTIPNLVALDMQLYGYTIKAETKWTNFPSLDFLT